MALDPDAVARRCADIMWPDDHAARGLGMEILDAAAGKATLRMTVRQDMVNGHGICHGGYIFMLADSAMAFASNSRNQKHLAQMAQVTFLAPGRLGTRLVAEAKERHRAERSGIYDVTVRTEAGETIAEFRGHTRSIAGLLVE